MMILANKIIKLRKQTGWSQEELAAQMGVSRQSVSKWESATSIPDLNKIIKLGEIFGVSTDYLVKDEIEEVEGISEDKEEGVVKVSLEEAKAYIEEKVKASKVIARGVLLCIYSIVPLLFLVALSEGKEPLISEKIATGIGLTLLFVLIAAGVVLFIGVGQYNKYSKIFEKSVFELAYGVESVIKEKSDAYAASYVKTLSTSIAMCIVSVVPLLMGGIFKATDRTLIMLVVLMFLVVGFGVFLMIPCIYLKNAYDCVLSEEDYSPEKRRENRKSDKFGGIYWPLVVAIYLIWSFWTNDWHITWIIWPVAGLLSASLSAVFGLFDGEK